MGLKFIFYAKTGRVEDNKIFSERSSSDILPHENNETYVHGIVSTKSTHPFESVTTLAEKCFASSIVECGLDFCENHFSC
ncbi:CLUMA_CG009188, isoform A [Clunio marinus]|uniref:CLUMA_CG009188, isoform A n=1 Tax=Clunio marinus TaxID=568069 RepID=A0A1J1I6B0_9DIPT|nr:CLUMA_CG009188, isoform A [Clunio marinus]